MHFLGRRALQQLILLLQRFRLRASVFVVVVFSFAHRVSGHVRRHRLT
jgi:hypothetical protein